MTAITFATPRRKYVVTSGRWFAWLGAAAILGYIAYRIFVHSSALLEPAIITPTADAHALLSPTIDARLSRLLGEHNGGSRVARPRLVALTFDDGPYPVTTPLLLDTLRDLHIRATFFLIGRDVNEQPELTARIVAAGHELADHTLTHPNLDELAPRAVRSELDEGAAVLKTYTADPDVARYMRPPHGRYTEETIRVAQQGGYTTVLWNDDPGDWRSVSEATLTAHVLAHASAPDIVLLHSGRLATVQMLPQIADRFRRAGFSFVTIHDLLRSTTPDELNHPEHFPLDKTAFTQP